MTTVLAEAEETFHPAQMTGTAGAILKQRSIPGFVVTEALYAKGLHLRQHYHRDAYLALVMAGEYHEQYSGHHCLCAPGMLRFLPAEERHENRFLEESRCLIVQIEPTMLSRLGEHASILSCPGPVPGIASALLANRLQREFLTGDSIAPLALEGVLLEILVESARTIGRADAVSAPKWLRRVREMVEEHYLSSPSLTELAAVAGVHQVHLSREFRKYYKCTLGEFIRKRRIEHACLLLARTDTALLDIALACGFSDQSHFSAMFKSHVGLTPAKFREMSA